MVCGLGTPNLDSLPEKKRRGRSSISWKSVTLDHIMVPETVFALSKKQFVHSKCILMMYLKCHGPSLRYFISGSLDAKVHIWSIPDCQVVDRNDLHEMVTAACYTPDGQVALVGSYKGSCCLYNTSENKLQQKAQINLQNKKNKSHQKKIIGFQFAPGSSSEVHITFADSRIQVIDGVDLVHKFKGRRGGKFQPKPKVQIERRNLVLTLLIQMQLSPFHVHNKLSQFLLKLNT